MYFRLLLLSLFHLLKAFSNFMLDIQNKKLSIDCIQIDLVIKKKIFSRFRESVYFALVLLGFIIKIHR